MMYLIKFQEVCAFFFKGNMCVECTIRTWQSSEHFLYFSVCLGYVVYHWNWGEWASAESALNSCVIDGVIKWTTNKYEILKNAN